MQNYPQYYCNSLVIIFLAAGDSGEDDRLQALTGDSTSISNDKRATVIKVLDSITEETIAKCVNLLEKLSIPTEADESEYVIKLYYHIFLSNPISSIHIKFYQAIFPNNKVISGRTAKPNTSHFISGLPLLITLC